MARFTLSAVRAPGGTPPADHGAHEAAYVIDQVNGIVAVNPWSAFVARRYPAAP